MISTTIAFPSVNEDDTDDVRDAIDTGFALWQTGEKTDAIRWLRRARDFADDAGQDRRALELARITADLNSSLTPVVTPTAAISPGSSHFSTGTSKSLGAPPVSTPPVSTPPVSAPSVSAPSVSAPSVSAPSVSAPSVSTPSTNPSTVSSPLNSNNSGEQRRSKLPEPTAVVRKFTDSTELTSTTPLQSATKSPPTSPPSSIEKNSTSLKPPTATTSLRPTSAKQRTSTVPQPQKQETALAESKLISVCVRIGSRDIDGSFRVYPMEAQTSATTTTQGILILSEKLWTSLERR